MRSLDNGVAIARKEYNMYAFRYNQVASGFPMQYLTKLLGFKSHYSIFGNPKSNNYHTEYETLDSGNEEVNSLSSLNYNKKKEEVKEDIKQNEEVEEREIVMQHSDVILKPTQDLNSLSDLNNKNS